MNILDWLHSKMYTGEYDPVMSSSPDFTQDDGETDPEALSWAKGKNPKLTTFGKVAKGLPGILQSGIAAAATPNIAYGGPTDIFRAMQGGQDYGQNRDLLNYNINRQKMQDALGVYRNSREDEDLLRKWTKEADDAKHQKALEDEASHRADIEEAKGQAAETGSFVGRGGQFDPSQTNIPISPISVTGVAPTADAAQGPVDLPMTIPPRSSLDVPTPLQAGYQAEPSLKYDLPGTRRSAPTASTLAAQKKAAEQANWPTIGNSDQADFFGFPIGTKVSPTEYTAYSAQHRQDTKPTTEKSLHFENHVNELNGDVTTIGYDPITGAEVSRKVEKGIAPKRPPSTASIGSPTDPHDIADGIIRGDLPPELTRLYGKGAAVEAELGRRGYPLATAQNDYRAIQRHLQTMNGNQQEALRQSITVASDSIPVVENLYEQWKQLGPASGFRDFNKAALVAASHLPGKAGSVATNLLSQIADMTSAIGSVYKGGNSSTDESLKLAATNLSADWNEQTFKDAIARLKMNIGIRRNSIYNSQPVGVTPNSPYVPQQNNQGTQGRAGDPLGIR